jgi:hypothetical protein
MRIFFDMDNIEKGKSDEETKVDLLLTVGEKAYQAEQTRPERAASQNRADL